jgi:hypothetical protein
MTTTEIEALYAQWELRIWTSGLSDEAMDAIVEEANVIERIIRKAPAATPAALLCKAKIAAHYIKEGSVVPYDRHMVKSLVADLERMARGT